MNAMLAKVAKVPQRHQHRQSLRPRSVPPRSTRTGRRRSPRSPSTVWPRTSPPRWPSSFVSTAQTRGRTESSGGGGRPGGRGRRQAVLRGHRARCDPGRRRAPPRVRLGLRHAPAPAVGPGLARDGDRGDRAAQPPAQDARLLDRAGPADRARRGRRLRPVHRDPAPSGPRSPATTSSPRSSTPSTRRAAPCCSPGSSSASPCSGCSPSGSPSSTGWPSPPPSACSSP